MTVTQVDQHRDKIGFPLSPFVCACRPVDRKEIEETPKAKMAMQQEWDRLRSRNAWDETNPREWSDVAREARQSGTEVRVGMIFGLVVEKNSDLPAGDARRKFKDKVVSQGNDVKNQNWENAMFADLGSSPSSMEAGRIVDACGMRSGYTIQQSDAAQAYLQAKIRGNRRGV